MVCLFEHLPKDLRLGSLSPGCLLMLSAILWALSGSWPHLSAADAPRAEHLQLGYEVFQHGDFTQAVQHWQAAADSYARDSNPRAQCGALLRLGQAYYALGHYHRAITNFDKARSLAQDTRDLRQLAMALGSLGNVQIATGKLKEAKALLQEAFDLSMQSRQDALSASIANNQGNLWMTQANPETAIAAYLYSVELAQRAGRRALAARAQINAAAAAQQTDDPAQAKSLLDDAYDTLIALPDSHSKAYTLSKAGLIYNGLRARWRSQNDALLLRAAESFRMAADMAQRLGDPLATSYALGYLGHLYEQEYRYEEALQLTRRASMSAQQLYAPEARYQWQWQTARLLLAMNRPTEALHTYRQAISTLQSIRHELTSSYGKAPTTFRATTGRIYFEFVDLLLKQTTQLQEASQKERYLDEARKTIELFKAAELQDYFQDDCVDATDLRETPLDDFTKTAVIIYPILLADRIELLVSMRHGLKQYTIPVSAEHLERVARHFRQSLQENQKRRYLRHAQRLYDWLIRPLEGELAHLPVNTLVFVPDGVLRQIPMAALHDGKDFLIRKYALAITPGLSLTDPKPLKRENIRPLALGLSQSVQGFSALPYVQEELTALKSLYDAKLMLNQDFVLSSVEQALRSGDYSILHIASHGQFVSDASQSFVLTFDAKLTIDLLETYIGRLRYREEPLELLTLSACETALGDDRAALGLAGIAIKAGARSALATLWHVADKASSQLVTHFYEALQEPSVSRAQALQRAQIELLNHPDYQSPFFWSPFLLINNWF
jgi:CHAT domain-containing protein